VRAANRECHLTAKGNHLLCRAWYRDSTAVGRFAPVGVKTRAREPKPVTHKTTSKMKARAIRVARELLIRTPVLCGVTHDSAQVYAMDDRGATDLSMTQQFPQCGYCIASAGHRVRLKATNGRLGGSSISAIPNDQVQPRAYPHSLHGGGVACGFERKEEGSRT
jgi:hypothetical protein